MARIGSYPIDAVIQDKDAWIGTENTNRVTRQFTALGVAEYIDTKNVGLVFVGATNALVGKKGLVPAPIAGDEGKYLKGGLGDGWTTIPVYTLDVPTGTTNVNLINTDGAGVVTNSFITLTGGTYLTSVHTSGSQITINHDDTVRTNPANPTPTPGAGTTLDLVSAVASNTTGHVTGVTTSTVTWPADSNTTYTMDVPTGTTSINLKGSDGTNDPIAFTTTGVNNGMTITSADVNNLNLSSIWQLNTRLVEGYVPEGNLQGNKFWATDANGNPGWTFQPSQDQSISSVGDSNITTGVALSQNGGTVFIRGAGTITASSDNTNGIITLTGTDQNTIYTLPVAVGAANSAEIVLTDNSAAAISTVTFNGTPTKIAISETIGNNGSITIGMPDDVTVTGELTVSGDDRSSFIGQVTIPQTPLVGTDAASKAYVDGLVEGGLTFKGSFNAATGLIVGGSTYLYQVTAGGAFDPAGARVAVAVGDYYVVATDGNFYGSDASVAGACATPGKLLDVGDSIIGLTIAAANVSVCAGWSVIQSDEGVVTFTNVNGTFVSATTVNTNAAGAVTMGTIDLSAGGTASGTTFLRGDNTWDVPAGTYVLPVATLADLGGVKLGSSATLTETYQTGGVGAGSQTYPVQLNAANQAGVSVPWTNLITSVSASDATTDLSGLTATPTTGAVVIGLDIDGRAAIPIASMDPDDTLMIYDDDTAINKKVSIGNLADYVGDGTAVANQVTYWTAANKIGGDAGFTKATGATGAITMGGTLSLGDNKELFFGAAPDYKIYHNSTTNVNHISSLIDRQLSINANNIFLTNQANDSTFLLLNSTGATFGGNVGIGITPNASSTVVDVLQLGKGMTIMGNVNDDRATMGANLYLDAGTAFRYVMDGYAGRFSIEDGQMIWGVSAIGNAGDVATVNTKMTLLNNGHLGIGAPTPRQKLEVAGRIYIEQQGTNWNETQPGAAVGALHLDPVGSGADNTGNAITFGASDSANGGNGNAGIYVRSDGSYGTKMYIATTDSYAIGSKTRVMIDESGNVGIGAVTPANLLSAYNTNSTLLNSKTPTGAAENGTGGGNRGFDGSFTNATRFSFTGTDSTDQGYGYFKWNVAGTETGIVSGKTYTIHFKHVATNGSLFQIITSSGTNFASNLVQNITKYPLPISGELYSLTFTATAAAAYIGFGALRTSGTMSLAMSEVQFIEGKPDTETGSIVAYKNLIVNGFGTSEINNGRLKITSEGTFNPATGMLQVRNFRTGATGAFTNNYVAEIRGATTSGALRGALLVHQQESDDTRPTMEVSDANGVFTTFVNQKVGIGTTTPDTKLHIYGSSTVSEMYLGEDAAVDKAGILKYNQGDGNGTGSVQLGNYGDSLNTAGVTIKKGGNVGIGTTSLGSKFNVKNDDGVGNGLHLIADFNRAGGADAQMILGYYGNGSAALGPVVYSANGKPLLLGANGGIQMSTDGSFTTGFNYTFRDGVGINNPNSVSAAAVAGYVMSVGRSSVGGVSGGIRSEGESHFVRGISFGPSGQGQILNYYEEGTWTPVIASVSGNPATATYYSALYTRTGKTVHCVFYAANISVSSMTSGTYIVVTGLPFNVSGYSDFTVSYKSGGWTGSNVVGGYGQNGVNYAYFMQANGLEAQRSQSPTMTRIMFNMTYQMQ